MSGYTNYPTEDFLIDKIDSMNESGVDLYSQLEALQEDVQYLTEEEYNRVGRHLSLEMLDIEQFISKNNCQRISNPIFYDKAGVPTEDGLMSDKIFGMTQYDRGGIFAYIDLGGYYLDPLCYKAWRDTNRYLKRIIAKDGQYIINSNGEIEEVENGGENGLEFLHKNIDKIKFTNNTKSIKRDLKIKYLNLNKKKMFINKYIVIPPYYRDTNSSSSKIIGVNKVNRFYQQIIIIANSLMSTQEYGFDMSGDQQFKLQENLLCIYDYFSGIKNENFNKDDIAMGISGKFGILRQGNMSKTADFAARLVISAPELKVNSPKDMIANFDKSAVPLSAVIACFEPFVQYHIKRFFETEFIGTEQYGAIDATGKTVYKTIKDPLLQFSDEVIKAQMMQFVHGYNNRLIPVVVEADDGSKTYMRFTGRYKALGDDPETIYNRKLTWLDVLYQAAVEAVRNKHVLISRFPIDTRTNQIATRVEVTSLKDTEPMYVGENFYKYYPKFSDADIGRDTSNMFIDTLNISNLYLVGLGGDYDGDQCVVKGVFTDEANDEIEQFMKDKKNFIGFGANNIRLVEGDSIQSLYCLTKILDQDKDKLSLPKFG